MNHVECCKKEVGGGRIQVNDILCSVANVMFSYDVVISMLKSPSLQHVHRKIFKSTREGPFDKAKKLDSLHQGVAVLVVYLLVTVFPRFVATFTLPETNSLFAPEK